MNRTIKDASVKRSHEDSHDRLRAHLADFLAAKNPARRLETLSGLTPCGYRCKVCTSQPDRPIVTPIRQMLGTEHPSRRAARCLGSPPPAPAGMASR